MKIAVPMLPPADRVWATQMLIVHGRIDRASRPSLIEIARSKKGEGAIYVRRFEGRGRGKGTMRN